MTLPVDILLAEIRRLRLFATGPIVVALDGPSGSGKSTLASLVAEALGATRVPCDDFFAAGIPAAGWDARTPAQRAADAIDWRPAPRRSHRAPARRQGRPLVRL